LVKIDHVYFGYCRETDTLKDVNLHISAGECVLLCGESGCGKTTVTKLINGLIPHFAENCSLQGEVTAASLDVAQTELYELSKEIGSVFQNPKSQFFNLDTDSELAFALENEGTDPVYIRARLAETVHNLHIEKLQRRNIFSLSGGEKQTLAFASVYAMNPKIFVLDEPSANLDYEAIEHLREQIDVLKAEGHTVIIAEHRLYYLTDFIDRAVYLKNGQIVRSFTHEEFLSMPDEYRVALGLRALKPTSIDLPKVRQEGTELGLSVEGLSFSYGKKVVFKELTFSTSPGEVLAITGPNGAGKTTLIRCLCGLLREQAGTIRLDGKRLKLKGRNKASFCVMQDVNHQLFSDSVWDECKLSSRDCEDEIIERILNDFDLLRFKDKHPMTLSGGQKQRLAVATALVSNKKLLIFDEPTSGLDHAQMMVVSSVVRKLADDGHIVLVVTHDWEFLKCACDRVLELKSYIG